MRITNVSLPVSDASASIIISYSDTYGNVGSLVASIPSVDNNATVAPGDLAIALQNLSQQTQGIEG